ncbi:hypothetical protein E5S67_03738 [Microcoleus sp. IPMA8]|uniref:Uncharacterized protein n=1 Tax=Microcoleus asticus IPMA8 TaxID=2563858 RepID=A0ABX2D089_9CYAN|nr:hypothetical protein [Microcoleus asticus IPMA8]
MDNKPFYLRTQEEKCPVSPAATFMEQGFKTEGRRVESPTEKAPPAFCLFPPASCLLPPASFIKDEL